MNAYGYMNKQVRGIAGGIAWTQQVFAKSPGYAPQDLVDAAVDIAWERLKKKPDHLDLAIEKQGNLIVFRLNDTAQGRGLRRAA